jgi:TnsA endonuclease N terminal
MPVRRIPPSYRSITGRLAAHKNIGPAHYESPLERDYLITLEADPAVVAYETQPIRLQYRDATGRVRPYTPDVLVDRRGGVRELCEVKYVADIRKLRAEHRERWLAAYRHSQEQGWRFLLITEQHARTARTRNWMFLSGFRVMSFPVGVLDNLVAVLADGGPMSVADWIKQSMHPRAEVLPAVWHLLCTGRVAVDMNQLLSLNSQVEVPHD